MDLGLKGKRALVSGSTASVHDLGIFEPRPFEEITASPPPRRWRPRRPALRVDGGVVRAIV